MTEAPGNAPEPVTEPVGSPADGTRVRRALARYVPLVAWVPAYPRSWLRSDIVAGVVSWGVMVPVAMAYAGLAGLPPEQGLITAFAALAVYAVLGTTRDLKVTTSSSIAIMSAAVVATIGSSGDPATYLALSAGLALIVGGILVASGLLRLGFLSQFLAKSVVTGFVVGLAITITVGQLPALLGLPSTGGSFFDRVLGLARQADDASLITALIGFISIAIILGCRRFAPKVPGALVALVFGILVVVALDLGAKGVAVVGDVDTGVPLPSLPRIPIVDLANLVVGAFGIVFLALAESLGAARSFATKNRYAIDPDQELIALGGANVAAGLFGGFSVDASLSQTATAATAGSRSQASSLVTSGLILATAIFIAPLFANLPTTVLAAIVITSVLSLVDIGELRRYFAWRRTDFALAMSALVGVVTTSALTGMAIAVGLSLLAILYKASQPYLAVLGRVDEHPPSFGDVTRHLSAVETPGVLILRPNVPLTFVNASVAQDQVMGMVRTREAPLQMVVLDIGATADLDVATTDMLTDLATELRERKIGLRLAQVRGQVRDRMRRTGLMSTLGEDSVFFGLAAAIDAALPDNAGVPASESM